jgi:hypothetical protein
MISPKSGSGKLQSSHPRNRTNPRTSYGSLCEKPELPGRYPPRRRDSPPGEGPVSESITVRAPDVSLNISNKVFSLFAPAAKWPPNPPPIKSTWCSPGIRHGNTRACSFCRVRRPGETVQNGQSRRRNGTARIRCTFWPNRHRWSCQLGPLKAPTGSVL